MISTNSLSFNNSWLSTSLFYVILCLSQNNKILNKNIIKTKEDKSS